jgi:hypothetical protein
MWLRITNQSFLSTFFLYTNQILKIKSSLSVTEKLHVLVKNDCKCYSLAKNKALARPLTALIGYVVG